MTAQPITVQLPTGLYNRLKRRAEQAHRSVEVEVLETVAAAVPVEQELSAELVLAIAKLAALSDSDLIKTVQNHFSEQKSTRLETLHLQRQASGLSQDEAQQAAVLADELEKFMFLRAQAMALLMQRGYNVASLIAK